MNYKKLLGAASAALLIVIAVLMLAPGALAASKYKTLYNFTGANDGGGPQAGLIFDPAGNLYGTTSGGGAYGEGTVFKLTPNESGGWIETVLYSFCALTECSDGRNPQAGLILDQAGNLYGTTVWSIYFNGCGYDSSCGVVFELTPNANGSWSETVIHSFDLSDGGRPQASLIFDANGNLYGTTMWGGPNQGGTVFQLTPSSDGSWTESVLYSFTGLNTDDGLYPWASLVFDAAGNLYGTTQSYDLNGGGTVFELTPNPDGSWSENVLHRFTGGKDGYWPVASLILDQTGNLYSTAEGGGASGYGTVFKLTPNSDGSWTKHGLHSFSAGEGYPLASLLFDHVGNLYGTTNGGNYGDGSVFKGTRNSKGAWSWKPLWTFRDRPGSHPYAGLISDAAGNLYSTTAGDGTTTFGSVFEITP